jgi:adhesin transport system outer membrane protein
MIRTRLAVAIAMIAFPLALPAAAVEPVAEPPAAVTASSQAGFLTLPEAVRHTVLSNPEVQAAFHEFQAAEQETRVARGGYYPRIDLEAGIGEERIDDPRFSDTDFGRDRVSVTLSQMLFDGFATRNEVRRLNHAARTRYYEVMESSEQAAADTARAYFDVLRHRDLVRMSEDNYATHRMIYDQIERRVRAGVSRRVDLEQAAGRLALSESNLLTDATNLHDVSMRYQRIVGELPPEGLEDPKITDSTRLPDSVKQTLQDAYRQSPLMAAAIANLWSSEAAADVTRAAFVPRFDLQARQDVWHDKDDIDGRYEEGVIELVMRYNLYNGGSDLAARRRQASRALQALDIRDKTCRDIRQSVSIAWNNTRRLEEQRTYLDRHQLSIEKAREAYRRQFEIGQRTLLDMLDTENEYYEARRAYLNADRDHAISYAQTLAGMGGLLAALQLGPRLHDMELPPGYDEITPDMYAICPQEGSAVPALDKEKIFRDAMEKQGYMGARTPTPEGPLPYMKGGSFEQGTQPAAPAGAPDAEEPPPPPKW